MGEQGKPPDEGTGAQVAAAYRKAGPYLDASWQLVGATGAWTFLGFWLDRFFGTRPWLLVGGAMLGMSLGFYLFFRALLALGKKEKR
ncbi:MAG: AtpZ/AtpI family protein [Deltaproteobacteria bacterium]|nr:AtpZ/AtpI family protein [Deltaproteobacteria bacterium]